MSFHTRTIWIAVAKKEPHLTSKQEDTMNSSIDYERMNRVKHKCVWWAAASIVVAAVFGILAYTPITRLLARQFFTPRPFLTAIRELAKQNQALAAYATAVRIDSAVAVKCDAPNLGAPWTMSNVFTPVSALSEFVISEDHQVVCLMIYEPPNNDSPRNENHPALTQIRRQEYTATFGDVPEQAKMFRLAVVRYNLGEMDLGKVVRNDLLPGLRNFYHDVPRLFPTQKQRDGLQFREQEESHYQRYFKDVRDELQRPQRVARATLSFIGFQGILALFVCFQLMNRLYLEYHKDMRKQELPVVKFRYFMFADDVVALTQGLLEHRRRWMRSENERRAVLRQMARRHREEQRLADVVAPREETLEQRQERHWLKFEGWCIELFKLTPPHPPTEMQRTSNICTQAEALLASNFQQVRVLMTRAIEDRKRLNIEQNYRPPAI